MDIDSLLTAINDSPLKFAGAITGGGTGAISTMLKHGGASATVLYLHVPYEPEFSVKYLGHTPDKLCSAETARMFAMKAYQDACEYNGEGSVFGLGATSALGKIEPEREGREHKIYVAIQTRFCTTTYTLLLTTPRSRAEEEEINEKLILHAIGETCGSSYFELPYGLTDDKERVEVYSSCPRNEIVNVVHQEFDQEFEGGAAYSLTGHTFKDVKLMLSASFNPLHDAHIRMAQIASEMTGHPCHFELAVTNADKPPLDYTSINQRLDTLQGSHGIWITSLPTFAEKAKHFAPVTFVVGADTVRRICDEQFYDSYDHMIFALLDMQEAEVKFICFSRIVDGKIQEALDKNILKVFRDMAIPVDSDVYLSDISSMEIRNG